MRTSLLIILGLTILVVASAGKTKKSEGDVEKSSPKPKSPPARKPTKKAAKEEDDGIPESLEDILKDDEDDEVEIPKVEDLTTESDPIELGQRIRGLTDKKKRKALVAELKRAWDKNKRIFPGKFYQAAYASLSNTKKAEQLARAFWDKEVEKVIEKAIKDSSEGIVSKTKAGLGDALGNAKKIAEIDPVGIALRRGESVFLNSLSNGLNTVGKVSDFAHDVTRNTSKLIRSSTFPFDMIPIVRQIKNNAHDYIEETTERGKFLIGSLAENGSTAFANAARNADKKADEKEELLRQFSSSRRLD